jgi:hypothetical protein
LADIRTKLGSLCEKVQTMRTDMHHFVLAAWKALQTQAQSIGAIALLPTSACLALPHASARGLATAFPYAVA